MRIVAAQLVPQSSPALGEIINLGRYEINLPEILTEKTHKATGVPGVRLFCRQDDGSYLFDLTIAPGIKLFDILARILEIQAPQIRCLRIKRKDCLVLSNGKLLSPFGEPVVK